jgi:hypothetical protein
MKEGGSLSWLFGTRFGSGIIFLPPGTSSPLPAMFFPRNPAISSHDAHISRALVPTGRATRLSLLSANASACRGNDLREPTPVRAQPKLAGDSIGHLEIRFKALAMLSGEGHKRCHLARPLGLVQPISRTRLKLCHFRKQALGAECFLMAFGERQLLRQMTVLVPEHRGRRTAVLLRYAAVCFATDQLSFDFRSLLTLANRTGSRHFLVPFTVLKQRPSHHAKKFPLHLDRAGREALWDGAFSRLRG